MRVRTVVAEELLLGISVLGVAAKEVRDLGSLLRLRPLATSSRDEVRIWQSHARDDQLHTYALARVQQSVRMYVLDDERLLSLLPN
jgi:hypothetical protein